MDCRSRKRAWSEHLTLALLIAALLLAAGSRSHAQEPTNDAQEQSAKPGPSSARANAGPQRSESWIEETTQSLSETTMSPFCPGRTLSACPSSQARQLRLSIQDWLREGASPQAVRNRLMVTYGKGVRGAPPAEGVGLMAWIVPAIFVLLFLLLVLAVLRSMRVQRKERQTSLEGEESGTELDPRMQARIERELEERRE